MAKKYISNKDESVALFENAMMDKFTYVHPSVPVILYVPVVSYFLYQAVVNSVPVLTIVGLFAFGLLTWTFVEYVIHRYVFHYHPKSAAGKYLFHLMHGVHHDYPNDSRRLVMPPVVSIPLAFTFYGLFLPFFGGVYILGFFPGFVFGYICYDMIHYATHHAPMKSKIAQAVKHHHIKHHYQDDDLGFGVSSPLWDFVFGTLFNKKPGSHA